MLLPTSSPERAAALPPPPAGTPETAPRRDVALDLLRGLAMVILVINHIHLESALEHATRALLSAAEVLAGVSGIVVGMVFGDRWRRHGGRHTTTLLLKRSRKLYVASVAVVALVGALTLVPGLATDVATISPRAPDRDLYDFDGPLRTLMAILTLEAGPWQFNILGFFIAALAAAPAVLWALARGWWLPLLAASLGLFAIGRATQLDVLPAQSEGPFPLLVWQVVFVPGVMLGWHRRNLARALKGSGPAIAATVLAAAAIAVYLRLNLLGHDPAGLQSLLGYAPADWVAWAGDHFQKSALDPVRVAAIGSIAAAVYLALRRFEHPVERLAGWLLLPLGRNSFYVFIVHVFLCIAIASVPFLAGDGLGPAGNAAVQLACLALLVAMVRRQFLFRWIPR